MAMRGNIHIITFNSSGKYSVLLSFNTSMTFRGGGKKKLKSPICVAQIAFELFSIRVWRCGSFFKCLWLIVNNYDNNSLGIWKHLSLWDTKKINKKCVHCEFCPATSGLQRHAALPLEEEFEITEQIGHQKRSRDKKLALFHMQIQKCHWFKWSVYVCVCPLTDRKAAETAGSPWWDRP